MVPRGTRQGPQSKQGDYFLYYFQRIALGDWVDVEENCSQVLLVSRVSMAVTRIELYRQGPHVTWKKQVGWGTRLGVVQQHPQNWY